MAIFFGNFRIAGSVAGGRTTVCNLLAGAAGLLCLAGPAAPANAAAPVVPLVSVHQHWDHHWFVWLPRHPLYESVEIMSIEPAGSPYRAAWVFFTERRGNKRQLHFLDDRRIVESYDGSHYRPIVYRRSGAAGRGQSVRVALKGLDGESIDIAVDLADRPLTRFGAGLTDQSGHSANAHFLLFHRDRNALAQRNEVKIGGRDYSFRPGDDPMGKHGFRAAYSAGIQLAVISFGRWSFVGRETKLIATAAGLSFSVAAGGGMRLTAPMPGYRNRISVDLDADGALTGYRHDAATHRLALSLDATLPLAPAAPRAVRRFAIHLNPDEPVARGEVISAPMAGGRRLIWRFRVPHWAAAYPFESVIRPNGDGHTLDIRSLRR